MNDIDTVLNAGPVIPVLVLDDAEQAPAVASALIEGGLVAIEVTLRTPVALEAIRRMAAVAGAIVGAGTVLNGRDVDMAAAAGARFIVSPGLSEAVVTAARAHGLPVLPGVSSASDIMRGLDMGLRRFKFFPAEAAGGLDALAALAAPFGELLFCPTGGITAASAPSWLHHPAVACVGGSWLVRPGMTLGAIATAARHAAGLKSASRRLDGTP